MGWDTSGEGFGTGPSHKTLLVLECVSTGFDLMHCLETVKRAMPHQHKGIGSIPSALLGLKVANLSKGMGLVTTPDAQTC